jgi:predicted ATPase
MLTNDEVYKLACNAVRKMFKEKGGNFLFPFDLIWQFTESESNIPSTSRPHQGRRLLINGLIEKTGALTRAASVKRAGSATPEYRFGPAILGGSLKFQLFDATPKLTKASAFPIVLLIKKNWNDFGYQTTYQAIIATSIESQIDLGEVKILHGKTIFDQSKLPTEFFVGHNNKICSLGQSLEYYEILSSVDVKIRNQYLEGLRDVVFNNDIKKAYQDNPIFKISLARFSSAMQALSDAPKFFLNGEESENADSASSINFTFQTKLSRNAEDVAINFDFQSIQGIPYRTIVIIGYNGTGKTQLLSNLATVTSGYGYKSKKDILANESGKFLDAPPNFGGVVVISYSAFDTFKIPGQNDAERTLLDQSGEFFGYSYCGLRKLIKNEGSEQIYGLKIHQEICEEYKEALSRIQSQEKNEIFAKILKPIISEASFQRIGLFQRKNDIPTERHFMSLSTGHKIVLTIIAQLTACLEKERRMLVIMDEPEAHLHPPLLAALLHSFRICLDEFDAHAVISTHSPIVLQETPARFVKILKRYENSSQVTRPTTETFGENIGIITQDIFNLDDNATDWHEVLKSLIENRNNSLEIIERKFGSKLGFTARSYVMSLIDER